MTSMAAALAASLPAAVSRQATPQPSATAQPAKVFPQRLEGVVDVEGAREVESVQLSSLVFLKMMKHSTDILPAPPSSTLQQDRNAPPPTALSSHIDCLGVLLGLDLDGVLEVEDSFALPGGETGLGANSYSDRLLTHLREVQTPDSPVGIYLSTHNGGSATRVAIDLLSAVEKVSGGRGKAVLIVHDASKANGNDLSVKAYRLGEGAREAAKAGKWDEKTLTEKGITSSTLLSPLPITVTSPSLISAFLSTLSTSAPNARPSAKPSLDSPAVPFPPNFSALVDPTPSSLTSYLQNTLDSLQLHSHEANNIAFLTRQIAREKVRHEQAIKDREEENAKRRKQGLSEFPAISSEIRGGTKEPSRLEMICLGGMVEGLAKGMGAEAGKGLVRNYL
ncbi:translation initiation factor 3 subunit H [Kwoniella heveanensis CBS 569]|nr:translation initiation factor 3 subunit H [Kwoniella heveanensis CBS 569]